MLPHGRPSFVQHPMQLPDQACGHGCAPILDGVAARNASLDPTTTHLTAWVMLVMAQALPDLELIEREASAQA